MSKQVTDHGITGTNLHLSDNERTTLVTIFLSGLCIEIEDIRKLNEFISLPPLKKILKKLADDGYIKFVPKFGDSKSLCKIVMGEITQIYHCYEDMHDDKKGGQPNKGRTHLKNLEKKMPIDHKAQKIIDIYQKAKTTDEAERLCLDLIDFSNE